ncbi:pre-mRNA splicing factor (U5 snRNP-associated), putative [Theileria annulata]|uniref:Pre-mRNA splicing factor (U5 snRNP-associated), putative n=1 Tax=Theileria annulata TaxID=5874 RepID=Q4UHY6_THEAN|nr:pre-mRNA splicing factor (U5 snRNP-associated), putative [Theileria annulata]CAI73303.1 pre-mRNA splicing factor (U5 snRNP-associated), putative [Theileria annulata]|eukprot:XP_953980.1 pre-mRNA splicing factor (U5 snRNP-associated), putative [Theileria annulata]
MTTLPTGKKFPLSASADSYYMPGVAKGLLAYTRSELGYNNATPSDPFGKPPPGYVPGKGRGATSFAGGVSRDDTHDDSDLNDLGGPYQVHCENEQLFKDAEYDDDDREADLVYEAIDAKMDERRKSRREQSLKSEITKLRSEKPTIHEQLAQYKRNLSTLTKEDWESIPYIGDYSLKRKQQKKQQTYVPAPDSLIYSSRASMQHTSSIGTETPLGFSTPLGIMGAKTPLGIQTPGGFTTPSGRTSSLNLLGEARGEVLSSTLDKVTDNLSGQTVVDPKGYLTDLNSMKTEFEEADVQKARTLLKSLINTNQKHAQGWIAAARMEELAGKIEAARELIAQGCENCPDKEDVWLEAARLEKPEYAKSILAKAIKIIPTSVKLWLEAADKETSNDNRKRVLRKALEFIPNSIRLWKEAISLENETNAYILLKRAVECVPESLDMWLALARLCPYEEAQKVLNEARKKLPTNVDIWITAAKLEESNKNYEMVDRIIVRAIDNLSKKGVVHIRSNWLKQAETAEANSFIKTAQSIIKNTMTIGVDDNNRKSTWLEDGETFVEHGSYECARTLYKTALEHMKTRTSLWLALVELESKHGTPDQVEEHLKSAVTYCPNSEILWLMYAKHKWVGGDVESSRAILSKALTMNENNEAISLAAVKLDRETHEYDRARKLLEKARTRCNTPKVWMKSVQLERQLKNYEKALELVEKALEIHPYFDKLWMISGQLKLEKQPKDIEGATLTYKQGVETCPWSVNLWLLSIELQIELKEFTKARALVETAKNKIRTIVGSSIKKNTDITKVQTKVLTNAELARMARLSMESDDPGSVKEMIEKITSQCDLIWLKGVEIELETGVRENAHFAMSKALQELPDSGLLWAHSIFLEEPNAQKTKAAEALKRNQNSPHIVLAAAKIFWNCKMIDKARRWFQTCITLDDSNGVSWGTFIAFELDCGTEESMKQAINKFIEAEPNRGYEWCRVTKKVENWNLSLPQKLYKFIEQHYPEVLTDKVPEDVLNVLNPPQVKKESD